MNDPHIWWYVTRTSAMLAWVIMTIAVLWGILLSTRIFRGADNPAWLQDLHRFLGGTAIILTLLHVVSLMLDPWLQLTPLEALVPFAGAFKPVAIALGIVSFYVLIAVQLSSLLKNRLPKRLWRGIHLASYVAVFAVALHGGAAGTDRGSWWYQAVATVIITASVLAIIVRIVMSSRRPTALPTAPVSGAPLQRSRMRVLAADDVAAGVRRIRLAPAEGGLVPPWSAGSHITVLLPDGTERQYSLCSDPADREHVEIAVLRVEPDGVGSTWLHTKLAVGDELDVVGPRNTFPLESAHRYLFIAAGIGITPIRAMIESLPSTRDWHLLYLGRSRRTMAFAAELLDRYPGRVEVMPRDERDARVDLTPALSQPDISVYACGPASVLDQVAAVVPPERCHLERFQAVDRSGGIDAAPFTVVAQSTGRRVAVSRDESMMEALLREGVSTPTSCGTGVCGTCETRVLAGIPLHLDSVMSDADKDEIGVVYPCVSRSRTPELVIDR